MIPKSMSILGFTLPHLMPKYVEVFRAEFVPQVASGEIKFAEDVTRGLHMVGVLLVKMLTGQNAGKAVVIVADE
jgi:NADPH-dependent curcumin reductase CurA